MSSDKFSQSAYQSLIEAGVDPVTAKKIAIASYDIAEGRTPSAENQQALIDFNQSFQQQVDAELLRMQRDGLIV